jgi:hypothetical protein
VREGVLQTAGPEVGSARENQSSEGADRDGEALQQVHGNTSSYHLMYRFAGHGGLRLQGQNAE